MPQVELCSMDKSVKYHHIPSQRRRHSISHLNKEALVANSKEVIQSIMQPSKRESSTIGLDTPKLAFNGVVILAQKNSEMDESSSIMNDGTPVSEQMVSPEHRLIANRSLGGNADARFPSIHESDIKKQKENIDGSEEEEEEQKVLIKTGGIGQENKSSNGIGSEDHDSSPDKQDADSEERKGNMQIVQQPPTDLADDQQPIQQEGDRPAAAVLENQEGDHCDDQPAAQMNNEQADEIGREDAEGAAVGCGLDDAFAEWENYDITDGVNELTITNEQVSSLNQSEGVNNQNVSRSVFTHAKKDKGKPTIFRQSWTTNQPNSSSRGIDQRSCTIQ